MSDPPAATVSELLILSDGRVLTRNVTPALADALAALDPANEALARRTARPAGPVHEPEGRPAKAQTRKASGASRRKQRSASIPTGKP